MNNDGGPAFPTTIYRTIGMDGSNPKEITELSPGLSLRDWFAGQATDADINGFIASKSWGKVSRSEARYMFADSMLAERAKGE